MDLNSSTRICGSLLLAFIPNVADYILNTITNRPLTRAFIDTFTHGLLGVVTWLVFEPTAVTSLASTKSTSGTWRTLVTPLSVFILASLIDLDHFLSARSFDLRDALRAPHRGIFHCTGLMLFLNVFLVGLKSQRGALLFMVSWIPHHLRDATRRGLYLYPNPTSGQVHTPPIPPALVTPLTIAFPWLIYFISTKFPSSVNQYQAIRQQVFTA